MEGNNKNIIPFSTLLLIASLIQLCYGIITILKNGILADFSIYYQYAKLYLEGGNPYQISVPFNYPPSFLLFFAPITVLPPIVAEIFFTTVSLALFIISTYLLLKKFITSLPFQIIAIALLLQFFPTKFTLAMGQVNFIVLIFLTLTYLFDAKGKQAISGICLGIASSLKLIPLPLLLYFLARKKYQSVFFALSFLIISNIIMLIFHPSLAYYFTNVFPHLATTIDKGTSIYDQSLHAFLARLGLETQNNLLSISIIAFLTIFTVWKYKRGEITDFALFSLILIFSTIGNSFTWQHHFVFIYPGIIAAAVISLKKKSAIRWILLSISFFLIGTHFPNPLNPPTTNPFLLSHTLLGTLILLYLLIK